MEPDEPLPPGVAAYVLRPDEAERLAAHDWPVHADRLVFCVKEAVYKVWSPLTGARPGFHDVSVTLERPGTFHARLLTADPLVAGTCPTVVSGRWGSDGAMLRVLAALPPAASPAAVAPQVRQR